ncbi:sulfotransferase domain-containing protein [Winogradskyella sp.]|uniref:sulfotransferase domain-containing protein n=1 Tax=Winogradskyella sp. TaxID=1883156 RepID=UPI003AB1D75C
MSKVFHIGIPKSGTTSIQSVLEKDERIALSRSAYFTTSLWWTHKEEPLVTNKINIESNETLITAGFNKVKLTEVFNRISKVHPDAKIIITIRKQEDAIVSMFKYHIKHNFKGVKTLENWMFKTNLGIDYLSVCMYGDIAKLLLLHFKKENIHFLFFEDLKTQPDDFYNAFYNILGLSFKPELKNRPKNIMTLSENQLYLLSRLNLWSLTQVNSEQNLTFRKLRSLEKRAKILMVKLFNTNRPKSFFKIEEIKGYKTLKEDYKASNKLLVELGFVEEAKLKAYNYNI